MKVCIFDIKRFAVHDGPGIRTTVFFKGCPLECPWCHNPEGIRPEIERFKEEIRLDGVSFEKEVELGRWIGVDELMDQLEQDRVFMEESGGGISFSGGEPLQQPEALFHLLNLAKERGFHTCLDTSGYTAAATMKMASMQADLILFDLKLMDDAKHREYTGVSNRRILENLETALEGSAEVNVRIPLIAGFNDSGGEIRAMLDYLRGLKNLDRVDILPYHPYGMHKYRRFKRENKQHGFSTPSAQRIGEIRKQFSDAGFRVQTGG